VWKLLKNNKKQCRAILFSMLIPTMKIMRVRIDTVLITQRYSKLQSCKTVEACQPLVHSQSFVTWLIGLFDINYHMQRPSLSVIMWKMKDTWHANSHDLLLTDFDIHL
jgi:hypothetical protein